MIDNLRRSLSAPALLLSLLCGWLLPPMAARVWTSFIFAVMAIPPFLPIVTGMLPTAPRVFPPVAFSASLPGCAAGSHAVALHAFISSACRLSFIGRHIANVVPRLFQRAASAAMGRLRAKRLYQATRQPCDTRVSAVGQFYLCRCCNDCHFPARTPERTYQCTISRALGSFTAYCPLGEPVPQH